MKVLAARSPAAVQRPAHASSSAAAPAVRSAFAGARLAAPRRMAPRSSAPLRTMALFGGGAKASTASIYDISVETIDGKTLSMNQFKNKVVLVVNVASACGMTPQYADLVALYDKYKSQGLEILAFPCNAFGGQESGSNSQIKSFAQNKGAKFTMLSKGEVNGPGEQPLWTYLKSKQGGLLGNDIKWNFTKFLVSRTGEVVARYPPTTPPLQFEAEIVKLLKNAACSNPNPICSSGKCVACSTDTQCRNKNNGYNYCNGGLCQATCSLSTQCTSSLTQPICTSSTCTRCLTSSQCQQRNGGNSYCRADGSCASTCTASSQCSLSATLPICSGTACQSCANSGECNSKNVNFPYCLPTGACSATCTLSSQCSLDPTKPICNGSSVCGACGNNADCNFTSKGLYCLPDGSCSNTCTADNQCLTATTPFCSSGTCVPCTVGAAGDAACSTRTGGAKPYCNADGSCVPPETKPVDAQNAQLDSNFFSAPPDGKVCADLAPTELDAVTNSICDQQVVYIVETQSWVRPRTECNGTSFCVLAKRRRSLLRAAESVELNPYEGFSDATMRNLLAPVAKVGYIKTITQVRTWSPQGQANPQTPLDATQTTLDTNPNNVINTPPPNTNPTTPPIVDATIVNQNPTCLSSAECPLAAEPICTGDKCRICFLDSECAVKDPSLPYCETTGANAGQCVECLTNGNCPATKGKCTNNVCGLCTVDADCSTQTPLPQCAVSGIFAGQCVECEVNADCGSGQFAGKPYCWGNFCSANQCYVDGDCSGVTGKPRCALTPDPNVCVECLDSADCTNNLGNPICNTATNTCGPCTADSQCAVKNALIADQKAFCDEGTGRCEQCTADAECTQFVGTLPNYCVNKLCTIQQCLLDKDCPFSTPWCDLTPDPNKCIECRSNADCGSGIFAGKPNCLAKSCTANQCLTDSDCSGATPYCNTGVSPTICQKCPMGFTDCSGTCKNLNKDPTNCGSCGYSCSNLGTNGCNNGVCAPFLGYSLGISGNANCGIAQTNTGFLLCEYTNGPHPEPTNCNGAGQHCVRYSPSAGDSCNLCNTRKVCLSESDMARIANSGGGGCF